MHFFLCTHGLRNDTINPKNTIIYVFAQIDCPLIFLLTCVSNEAIGSLPVEKKNSRNRNAQKASSIANSVFYLHTLHGKAFCMAFGQSKLSSSNVGCVVDEIAEYEMYEKDCAAHVASTKWLEWLLIRSEKTQSSSAHTNTAIDVCKTDRGWCCGTKKEHIDE